MMPNQWKPTRKFLEHYYRWALTYCFHSLAPLEQMEPTIWQLWAAHQSHYQIVDALQDIFDTNQYGIRWVGCHDYHVILYWIDHTSLTKLIKICNSLGLIWTQQQAHTPASICAPMVELQKMYLQAGCQEMVSLLFHEQGLSVSRYTLWQLVTTVSYHPDAHFDRLVVEEYFKLYEPHLVRGWRAN